MYLILPTSNSPTALRDFESRLNSEILDSFIDRLQIESCIIGIPKMKLSTTLNLNRALQELGLTSLFNPYEANLALLSSGLNETHEQDTNKRDDGIFSRIGDTNEATTSKRDFSNKNGYIRYEDTRGGYSIQQWANGVFIENNRKAKTNNRTKRTSVINKNNNDDGKLFDKFKKLNLNRKRKRSVDDNFGEFIERQDIAQYGIDMLRNSGQLNNPGLFASDVIHKVEIDITETGTVAASATSVTLSRSGHHKRFVADRPFNFFIRHNPTKLILFQGTINKPTPNYF